MYEKDRSMKLRSYFCPNVKCLELLFSLFFLLPVPFEYQYFSFSSFEQVTIILENHLVIFNPISESEGQPSIFALPARYLELK